jgi:hypothetical protein
MNYFRSSSGRSNVPEALVQIHPYSPLGITIDGYVRNDKEAVELLLSFAAVWVPIFLTAWGLASAYNRSLKASDKLVMMWFTLCTHSSEAARTLS